MVIIKGSVSSIPRSLKVSTIGRFKLLEIENIDQSPLAFKFLKEKTYVKRGERTILLKSTKSRWDKRQCTL
jgi:hypothetical protein